MPEYNEKDLIKMQNDAMKRVMEMQRRAKESYSASQTPEQNSPEPTFSSQSGAAQEEVFLQSKSFHPPMQSPELVRQLFILLGTDDPVLSAALAYLL
ncbi:MAG TPA: hypothetical protein PK854_00760 [Oscillospiraceae bacterium]|nr:hypothetical protein [Oscillospiraceae bacterium]HPS33784.1 hypothetical protein [Oscillospiraceae bacterium]